MKKVRLGIIGLGHRGFSMLRDNLINFEELEFTAVCDLYPDRVEDATKFIREKRPDAPAILETTDYREVLGCGKVDAVYVSSAWESHIMIAIAALRAKIAVVCEVGGSYTVEECFDLVRAYEETGTPFMLAENCCYDKNELLATSMARAGKFGKIVHCSGAYAHDLREEITHGNINRHYRLRNYTNRNCENYPTHELGPIARLLNINRGNRLVSLVSMASCAYGLEEYIKKNNLAELDPTLKDRKFKQGDIVTTIIKCAGGETITLTLDTTLPRSYDRAFTVRGTNGYYSMSTNSVYFDGMPELWDPVQHVKDTIDNAKEYEEEFLPPVWKNITEEDKKRGHGGMDGILFARFIKNFLNGDPMEIDVYDAAAWMCISALSEKSIAQGGAVVDIPDFTNGKWLVREPIDVMPLGSFVDENEK